MSSNSPNAKAGIAFHFIPAYRAEPYYAGEGVTSKFIAYFDETLLQARSCGWSKRNPPPNVYHRIAISLPRM